MRIGVAREIKPQEHRVALPLRERASSSSTATRSLVEAGAGLGSAFPDDAYERAGATIVSVDDVWARSELLLKVKEPIALEYPRLRQGLTLFTYLHMAADEPLTRALVDSGITGIAYETVETDLGALPLLAPMSEIAGRLAPRRARTTSRSRRAAAASCSAASQGSRRARSSSSAAGWSATTPRSSPSGWARR